MNEQLKRYELIDPPEADYEARIEFIERQIMEFKVQNENKFPFVVYSNNQNWNEIFLTSDKDMLISSNEDIEYYAITFLNSQWANSTTTMDMAFEDQQTINHTFGLYQEFCYRKEQIPYKRFHNAYASMHDAIMSLIR